jgi:FixJ family two-component response regulator
LLLDIRMPGMSGTELQERLPGTDHDVPVVFLTGYADIPTCVRAMKAGAVGFLVKPFNDTELLDAIGGALRAARTRAAADAQRVAATSRLNRLSPREREVCVGVVAGSLNKQIAAAMGISEKTVKVHRARVMEKLQVGSVAEMVQLVALVWPPAQPVGEGGAG